MCKGHCGGSKGHSLAESAWAKAHPMGEIGFKGFGG